MNDSHDFFVGTILGFQALAGEVKIKTSTNSPDLLVDVQSVRIQYAKGMEPLGNTQKILKVRSARVEKRMLLMAFEGFDDRTGVEPMEGAVLYCKEDELLPLEEEEFWVHDLVGIEVFTTGGAPVGKVIAIISTGSDILEVQPEGTTDGKTILIPFIKKIVPVVDMKKRRIEVVDIPGLLEAQ